MKHFIFTLAFCICIGAFGFPAMGNNSGDATDFIFTYDYPDAKHDLFGAQRCVLIDAAMLIDDPSVMGCEITGISVEIPTKEGCECDSIASAWLTSKLQVDGEYNLPDIMQVNGVIRNYGSETDPDLRLDISFPQPYKVPAEGIYVGYSLNVTTCSVPGSGYTLKYPLVTVCDIDRPQSFMIHCTKGESVIPQKYPEWTDIGATLHQALAMKVMMRGDVVENSASLQPLQTLYVAPDSTGYVYTNLNNHGYSPVNSIEYSYSVSDDSSSYSFTKEVVLEKPLQGQPGSYTTLDIPFESPETTGQYKVDIRLEKVNGIENNYSGTATFNMEVVPFLPKNRIPVEDYTGMWCGYCPEVYVMLKQMTDKYGDDLLSLAYHVDDKIQTVSATNLPSSAYGLPKVYIENRDEAIAPADIENIWLLKRRELAPADINVSICWTDDTRSALQAESETCFVFDESNSDYKLAYALVEDNMSNPEWKQDNKFSNADFTGPYWDLFIGKGYTVKGLIYDDIIVNFPSPSGISGSLPGNIEAGTSYKHSCVLDLKDATCCYVGSPNYGENVIQDPDGLRVVALLIDGKTGFVKNAASSPYAKEAPVDPAGIDSPMTGVTISEIVSMEYFSAEGNRLSCAPEKGLYIVAKHLSNGQILTEKIVN